MGPSAPLTTTLLRPGISSSMNGPRTEAGPWPRARTTAASRAVSCSSARPAAPRRSRYSSRMATGAPRTPRAAAARPGSPGPPPGPPQRRARREGAGQPEPCSSAATRSAITALHDASGGSTRAARPGRPPAARGTPRPRTLGDLVRGGARAEEQRIGLVGRRLVGEARADTGRSRSAEAGTRRAPASDGTSARSASSARPAGAAAPVLVRVVTAPRMGDGSAGFKRPASQRARFIHRAKRRVRRLARRHKAAERGPRI